MNLSKFFKNYQSELYNLSKELYRVSLRMQKIGCSVVFGDFEGEIAYILLRETKPELVFEISTAAGYSSNYLLAPLTKNKKASCILFRYQNGYIVEKLPQ